MMMRKKTRTTEYLWGGGKRDFGPKKKLGFDRFVSCIARERERDLESTVVAVVVVIS